MRAARVAGEAALSTHADEVAANLMRQLSERLAKAGVEVKEARLSHLASSPEIAQAMLQRQQAGAIIAARSRIVEGAVGMVENALDLLAERQLSSSTTNGGRRWPRIYWSCFAGNGEPSR